MTDGKYEFVGALTEDERARTYKLIEECSEVIHAATKILRFGPDNWHPERGPNVTNVDDLRRELRDLKAAIAEI